MVAIITPGQGERSAGKEVNWVIWVTQNADTMTGQISEILEMLLCARIKVEMNQLGQLQRKIHTSSFSGILERGKLW